MSNYSLDMEGLDIDAYMKLQPNPCPKFGSEHVDTRTYNVHALKTGIETKLVFLNCANCGHGGPVRSTIVSATVEWNKGGTNS